MQQEPRNDTPGKKHSLFPRPKRIETSPKCKEHHQNHVCINLVKNPKFCAKRIIFSTLFSKCCKTLPNFNKDLLKFVNFNFNGTKAHSTNFW